jgi:hypothetical protein
MAVGADAARHFYEGDRFDRTNSMPRSVSHLLTTTGWPSSRVAKVSVCNRRHARVPKR